MADITNLKLDRDAWGRLILTLADGQSYVGIDAIRCFPLSDPERSIALVDADGHEILTLAGLDVLEPEARKVLESELAAREFVPEIRRIISTSNPNPPCRWTVETDRGETGFQLESEDDIRKLGANRIMISDSNGIRYMIPDIRNLDSASQRVVQRLV